MCAGAGPPGGGDLAVRGGGAAAVRAARPLLRGRVRAEAAADTAGVPPARSQPGEVRGEIAGIPKQRNKIYCLCCKIECQNIQKHIYIKAYCNLINA